MPDPIITPDLSWSSSFMGRQPESCTASIAATIPNWMNRSNLRCSFSSINASRSSDPSRPSCGTCPAIWQARSSISKPSIRPMPLSEAISFVQLWSRPTPKGETIPIPVITTRRILPFLFYLDGLDQIIFDSYCLKGATKPPPNSSQKKSTAGLCAR